MSDYRTDFFTNVFTSRLWHSQESASGHGSDTVNTRNLVKELPNLLHRLQVHSLLDVPCGDFNWMRDVALDGIEYIGGDIVPEIVAENSANYARPGLRFEIIDLVKDDLPLVDMVFIRDCFLHFTNDLIVEALQNIARSRIQYLCISHINTFSPWGGSGGKNIELERAVEGVNYEFRPLNFQLPPFNFPTPIDFVYDSGPGMSPEKIMAAWKVEDILTCLSN